MTIAKAAVHPFPARMAPELAAAKVSSLRDNAVVLDPMMGSGTFPLAAARSGHQAFGCDTDPLAVVIANTIAANYSLENFLSAAESVVAKARVAKEVDIQVDSETSKFIDFWFDPIARRHLSSLAMAIKEFPAPLSFPLWCAFSRLIIAKDAGASRARDVSHSRPHRVRETASFNPIEKFMASAKAVATRVSHSRAESTAVGFPSPAPTILRADARRLPFARATVDAVMTSPPYLIAIDYLRGHRMSLVWMGYSIAYLRSLRSSNIGSEVGMAVDSSLHAIAQSSFDGSLPDRSQRIIGRYVQDLDQVMSEIARVVRPGGTVSFVMADARMNGIEVSIEEILTRLGARNGLTSRARISRELPENRRYLPPPRNAEGALDKRMKEEVILTFERG
jgi:tRNA G10  N-methylase Trm11